MISLLCVVVVISVPAWFQAQRLLTQMLGQDASNTQMFVQTIWRHLDVQAYLPDLPLKSPDVPYDTFFKQHQSEYTNRIFTAFAQQLREHTEIVGINIYAPNGTHIWSSQPWENRLDLTNPKLVQALTGEIAVSMEPLGEPHGHVPEATNLSTTEKVAGMYLPIWSAASQEVAGVVQLSKTSIELFKAIDQGQRWIWIAATVIGTLVYSVLWRCRYVGFQLVQIAATPGRHLLSHGVYKFYALLAILFVTLLIIGPAWGVSRYIDHRMLDRDARVTMQFVQTLLEDMDARAYLPRPASTDPEPTYADFFTQTEPARLRAIFGDLCKRIPLQQLDIVRVSVYAPDGMRIWATQPAQEGIRWLGNAKLVRALTGKLAVARDVRVYELTPSERSRITSEHPVYSEMYMPIWSLSRDTVVGVVEVYKDSKVLFDAITRGKSWFWGITISLGFLLLSLLLGIMRRAVRVMAHQRERLVRTEALSVVGEMVVAITDLLRQPLAVIETKAETIRAHKQLTIASQGQDIQTEVSQLRRWLQGLQSYAQPNGRGSTGVDLSSSIVTLTSHLNPTFGQQNIQLHVGRCDDLPLVKGDAVMLQQVFHTIIANAQDAMPDGGSLYIEVEPNLLRSCVDIRFSDTGYGMNTEQLKSVFQPFFTTKQKGLGIGMTLAKRVVERYDGAITIKSIPGRGTTVILSWPVVSLSARETQT